MVSIVRAPCYCWVLLSIGSCDRSSVHIACSYVMLSLSSTSRLILYSMLFNLFKCLSTIRSRFCFTFEGSTPTRTLVRTPLGVRDRLGCAPTQNRKAQCAALMLIYGRPWPNARVVSTRNKASILIHVFVIPI